MNMDAISENLQKIGIWKRLFFMLVFAVIAGIVRILIWALVALQVLTVLITGDANRNVVGFARSLSAYMYHILLFMTFNTDDMAFPFASWSLNKEPDLGNLNPRN